MAGGDGGDCAGPASLEPMNWGYEGLGLEDYLQAAYGKGAALEKIRR